MTEDEMRAHVATELDSAADAIWRRLKSEGFATEQIVKAIAVNMLNLAVVDLIELNMDEAEFMKLCRRRYRANQARRMKELQ